MTWTQTEDVGEFLRSAGSLLRADPAEHTVLLTAAEMVSLQGVAAYGEVTPWFGWWQAPGGRVGAAFLHTPPFPLTFTVMTGEQATALAGLLAARGRDLAGVNADAASATAFATAWQARTGQAFEVGMRTRLFRLGRLRMPAPVPAGQARVATEADRDLLIAWLGEFGREAGSGPDNAARLADDRLRFGGITLWETDGEPVSLAGAHRQVAGQVRVGPVYTPPPQRGRGFGGAVTAVVSQAALAAGAQEVVLFTDLANPTSNALYPRIGYQPIADRVVLKFSPPR